ncbi:hypothetical protein ACFLX2_00700 [Candidatus Dependentiae bacterium]
MKKMNMAIVGCLGVLLFASTGLWASQRPPVRPGMTWRMSLVVDNLVEAKETTEPVAAFLDLSDDESEWERNLDAQRQGLRGAARLSTDEMESYTRDSFNHLRWSQDRIEEEEQRGMISSEASEPLVRFHINLKRSVQVIPQILKLPPREVNLRWARERVRTELPNARAAIDDFTRVQDKRGVPASLIGHMQAAQASVLRAIQEIIRLVERAQGGRRPVADPGLAPRPSAGAPSQSRPASFQRPQLEPGPRPASSPQAPPMNFWQKIKFIFTGGHGTNVWQRIKYLFTGTI